MVRGTSYRALCALCLYLSSLVHGEETYTADTPTSEFTDDWSRITFNTSTEPLFTVSTPDGYGNYDDVDEEEKPKVLFAQGKYLMFAFPEHNDCTAYKYAEKLPQWDAVKLCTGSEKLSWWWIYDWIGGQNHNLQLTDIGDNVIFKTTFTSLPDKPPDLTYVDVKSGAGWMFIYSRIAPEPLPNLIGFEVLYKTDRDKFWWRSYVETVDYSGDLPYVRPAHYCPEFRADGTLCLMVSDGIEPMSEGYKSIMYQMRFASFRVQPFNRSFGTAVFTEYKVDYCDWLKDECYPPMGKGLDDESDLSYDFRTAAPDQPQGNGTSSSVSPPNLDISTTMSPEWWMENASEPQPPLRFLSNDDLWLLFLALLLIAICIVIPFAIWAGTRAGYNEAARNWAELTSSAGNVNIPLGYVATEWEDATLPPD